MGSSSKAKDSARPQRMLVSGLRPSAATSSGGEGPATSDRASPKTRLLQLVGIDPEIHRRVHVGEAVQLKDVTKTIEVLWSRKRLGDIRRGDVSRVRATKATAAVIAQLQSKPVAAWIELR
jgi:hypothetical protein